MHGHSRRRVPSTTCQAWMYGNSLLGTWSSRSCASATTAVCTVIESGLRPGGRSRALGGVRLEAREGQPVAARGIDGGSLGAEGCKQAAHRAGVELLGGVEANVGPPWEDVDHDRHHHRSHAMKPTDLAPSTGSGVWPSRHCLAGRLRPTAQRRVLLAVHTLLTLRYIRRHLNILRQDQRLAFYATQGADDYSVGVAAALPRLCLPMIPFDEAAAQQWDLALFATHGGEIFFRDTACKIHIQHGIGAGKRVDGHDFTYGRPWVLWEGRPKYDLMLESSHSTMRRAVAAVPELADRVRVVGDPFADDVLHGMQHRCRFRAQLGIEQGQTAVLLMSTWGQHGLLAAHGRDLLEAALRLPRKYKILLTMHDHLWTGGRDEASPWPSRLAQLPKDQFAICGLLQDWVPHVIAADVAILDHGSLGLYYALTCKPAITAHVPEYVVVPNAPATRLRACYPLLESTAHLQRVVDDVQRHHDPQAVGRFLGDITSYPGQAVPRIRAVLYERLRLSPLGSETVSQGRD
jgi:hypothetical protein